MMLCQGEPRPAVKITLSDKNQIAPLSLCMGAAISHTALGAFKATCRNHLLSHPNSKQIHQILKPVESVAACLSFFSCSPTLHYFHFFVHFSM